MIPRNNKHRRGQNVVEYLIVMAGVITVVILAANSGGVFTRGANRAIGMMMNSVEVVATEPCLTPADIVPGLWGDWTSWSPCVSCTQTRTHVCDSPAPRCGGAPCDGGDGLIETETRACTGGDSTWLVGSPGACVGACGYDTGVRALLVTCDGGCCDPPAPSSTEGCFKEKYPDLWVEFNDWVCDRACGPGIAGQTVTCGDCCDPDLKPPTRQACTEGCCTENLYIGRDVENSTAFTADFIGPKPNGQPYSASCPSGYAGNPTRTCSATASGSCAGNDTYTPDPASCYTIAWGALSGECQPAACAPVTVDAGYGRAWDVPFTPHGATATLTCSGGGWSYTGNASYECWLGAWRNLSAGCVPNCPAATLAVGSSQTGLFPETASGATGSSACPCGYRSNSNPQRPCNAGAWGDLVAGTECTLRQCGPERFTVVTTPVVTGTFTADHGQTATLDCATQLDSGDPRFTGSALMRCDWCANPSSGWTAADYQCAARNCDAPYTPTVNGVTVRFDPAGHGTPRTVQCGDFSSGTATGSVSSQCCFGTWIDPGPGCTGGEPQGYSGGCRAFACQSDFYPSNATKCSQTGSDPNDETSLTADTNWSLVNNTGSGWECTSAKCQYNCNDGYVQSGLNCVAAVCTGGNPDPSGRASMCAGDGNPVVNTARTLPSSGCSSPGGSDPKCEYYCPSTDVIYNGGCCLDQCPGGSCGTQTVCGAPKNCGNCCGNGALDGAEPCDWNGPRFDPSRDTCSEVNATYTGGTLGCYGASASSPCTFDTTGCCTAANGTWGASWTDISGCVSCLKQQQGTCNDASCGGSCPADPANGITASGTRNVACGFVQGTWSGWTASACSLSCGGGFLTESRTCNGVACGGECQRLDGSYTTPGDRTESRTVSGCNPGPCGGWIPMPTNNACCPGWSCGPRYGGQSCASLCAANGLSSGFDTSGKTCRSDETGIGGTWTVNRNCQGKGGSSRWFCYNSGQVEDQNNTDFITACYCVP